MIEPMPAHIGDRYHSPVPSFCSSNTAYTGADGHINILDLDDDDLNNESLTSSTIKSVKPALSTRLLSSLPGAQPAAAAALTRSKTILHSRAKSLAAWTSSFNTSAAEKPANRLFGDIFSGESAPVRLGVSATSPRREVEEEELVMDYRPALTSRPSTGSRRKSTVLTPAVQSSSKSSWFSRNNTTAAAHTHSPATVNDELLTLNINNALFPNGPVDALSPSDFNDLLLNATRLLERMQSAYREKVEYIAAIQPEIDAQREEVEEADTRAQHLKMQLEDMGRKAQEHELAVTQLAAQLSTEKLRKEEVTAKTLRGIDDDVTPRRRKRGSAGSASDSGFESDWDRDTESVASSGMPMPTPRTPPAVMTGSPFDNLDQRLHDRRLKLQRQAPLRAINLGYGRQSEETTVAWDTVQQLRGENHDLRRHVEVMQRTLQGCIDFVDSTHI